MAYISYKWGGPELKFIYADNIKQSFAFYCLLQQLILKPTEIKQQHNLKQFDLNIAFMCKIHIFYYHKSANILSSLRVIDLSSYNLKMIITILSL